MNRSISANCSKKIGKPVQKNAREKNFGKLSFRQIIFKLTNLIQSPRFVQKMAVEK